MQSDFDDLRFTKADGETLIDAWLESKTDNTSAIIWVEFPTTPANTITEDYYMYYGNSGGNVWNITDTFLFGDNFEDLLPIFDIDFHCDTGNFGCWADHDMIQFDNDVWIYYNTYEADGIFNIGRRIYNIVSNTVTTENGALWDDGIEHAMPKITKIGSTYHLIYETRISGDTFAPYKRTSSDGLTFINESKLDTQNGNHHIHPRILKINDTEFWIYYTYGTTGTDYMRRIVYNGTYNSPVDVFSENYQLMGTEIKKFGSTYYIYYGMYVGTSNRPIHVRSSSDGITWSASSTIISSDYCGGAISVEQIGDDYYLFYVDETNKAVKILKGSSPISFNHFQTLHTGNYRATDTLIFNVDKVLLTYSEPTGTSSNPTGGLFAEQLSLGTSPSATINSDKWDVSGAVGTWAITNGILQGNAAATGYLNSKISTPTDISIHTKTKTISGAQGYICSHSSGSGDPGSAAYMMDTHITNNFIYLRKNLANQAASETYDFLLDTWYLSEFNFLSPNLKGTIFNESGSQLATINWNDSSPLTNGKSGSPRLYNNTQQYDYIFICKNIINPATYGFGGEESTSSGNPYWYYNLLKRRN